LEVQDKIQRIKELCIATTLLSMTRSLSKEEKN